MRLLGGLVVCISTLYCSPRLRSGRGRGGQGGGLYPELAALGVGGGCTPALASLVGRTVATLPIHLAQQELHRQGLKLDEKAIHRIAVQLGVQLLTTRTRDLSRWRAGELPQGRAFAGKRIAVQIDGGRVRVRTIVKKSKRKLGGKRKRQRFRVEWREPKVVVLYELDEQGRMLAGSRPLIDGTLGGPDALAELVALHLHRLGAAAAQEVVFVADGAPWIWDRLDWIVGRVGLEPARVFRVLDWCHAVHHISVALEALGFEKQNRRETYRRLRRLLKAGKHEALIDELHTLAEGVAEDSDVWREIRFFERHADAGRLRYDCFRYRRLPIGSGAIESTIRRVINLRLKGGGLFWKEENAEAIFQLRASLLSGRWDETLAHVRQTMARDRRFDWHWQPPDTLAELKAQSVQPPPNTQLLNPQRPTARAA